MDISISSVVTLFLNPRLPWQYSSNTYTNRPLTLLQDSEYLQVVIDVVVVVVFDVADVVVVVIFMLKWR